MIFLCFTLLKKGNSTHRFSFAKESNMRRNWNDIFVFYFFEKGKQYTEIFLCKREQQEKKLKWYFCVLLFWKREIVHRDFPLQKMPTRKENEMIFLCLDVTLLKKGNSTQRFSFAKESNKRRIWNNIFVFVCYSFEKGKQYTGKSLCTVHLFQRKEIETTFLYLSFSFEKGKQYTEIFLCTVYLF